MAYWSYPLKTLDGGGAGGCISPQTPKGSCQGYFQPGMRWELVLGSGGSWRVALGSFSFRDLEVSCRGGAAQLGSEGPSPYSELPFRGWQSLTGYVWG